MSFSNEHTVKATRKDHVCDCCRFPILKGASAVRWSGMTDGDFGHAIMHPDCREAEIAYNRTIGSDWDEWSRLEDLERDEEPWLRKKFPAVADRVFGRKEPAEPAHG